MRNYENKTKEDLLEIIEQLEKKIDFLSLILQILPLPSKGRFRDKYSTWILMLFLTCSPSSTITPIL